MVMMSWALRVESRPPRVLSSRAGLVSAFFGVQRVLERNPAPELVFAGQRACYPTCSMTGASVSRVTQLCDQGTRKTGDGMILAG